MIKQAYEEWKKEACERFGDESKKWAFTCPSCGRTHMVQDFEDRGLDTNKALQECLGRHDKTIGCDWAAYGLLGTLGKGRLVETPDGDKVEVFDFAAVQDAS